MDSRLRYGGLALAFKRCGITVRIVAPGCLLATSKMGRSPVRITVGDLTGRGGAR